jgi:RNA polymerase sigma factor (sigma-70 family)
MIRARRKHADAAVREQALMAAYARGDDRALEALFNLMAPRILSFLHCCLSEPEPEPRLAEELLQATFVRLHRSRHTYRRGTPVRPWLFAVAASVQRDAVGRLPSFDACAGAASEGLPQPSATSAADGGRVAGDLEPGRAVRQAIAALQSSQRVVIQLHRFEGLSFAEIAEVLGASEATVRAQAFCVYQQLRERLRPLVRERDDL